MAAAGYGLQPDIQQPALRAYHSIKGVRDITSGLLVAVSMVAGAPHLLGWIVLAAAAAVMLGTTAVLLVD